MDSQMMEKMKMHAQAILDLCGSGESEMPEAEADEGSMPSPASSGTKPGLAALDMIMGKGGR